MFTPHLTSGMSVCALTLYWLPSTLVLVKWVITIQRVVQRVVRLRRSLILSQENRNALWELVDLRGFEARSRG